MWMVTTAGITRRRSQGLLGNFTCTALVELLDCHVYADVCQHYCLPLLFKYLFKDQIVQIQPVQA